jgi:ABC-type nitrate/sulfonate/bicarbonate transport system permease component
MSLMALAWEVFATARNDPRLFPSIPHIVFVSLPSLGVFSQSGEMGFIGALQVLTYHSAITILRILLALLLGIPSGIASGLFVHYLRGAGPVSAWTLTVIRSIPLLALIPLFAFWFGTSEVGIVSYISFGIFLVISSDTYEAAANVSVIFLQQGRLLGASNARLLLTVYLPGVQAQLMAGFRNVLGLSWAFALGAEYISATSGLGYIVYQSYLYSDMGKLAVLALLYMGFGYVIFEMSSKAFELIAPWAITGKRLER